MHPRSLLPRTFPNAAPVHSRSGSGGSVGLTAKQTVGVSFRGDHLAPLGRWRRYARPQPRGPRSDLEDRPVAGVQLADERDAGIAEPGRRTSGIHEDLRDVVLGEPGVVPERPVRTEELAELRETFDRAGPSVVHVAKVGQIELVPPVRGKERRAQRPLVVVGPVGDIAADEQ